MANRARRIAWACAAWVALGGGCGSDAQDGASPAPGDVGVGDGTPGDTQGRAGESGGVGVGGAGGSSEAPQAIQSGLEIAIESGVVVGALDAGARMFRGIPYAAAPVGSLRWRAPQPVEPWSGARDATVFGPACPQGTGIGAAAPAAEDCLFLNVSTPDPTPAEALPVMVWFPGGGWTTGSGHGVEFALPGADPYYDGQHLAAEAGVVVVTVNYRLGPLGFLSLEALTNEDPDHPSSGNYALEDQQAALEWVERNIAAFGGDAGNVTIFGESAGGQSVCLQLASPRSAGLFHRAIVQSGACRSARASLAVADEEARTVLAPLGCADGDLACLRSKTPEELLALSGSYGVWAPVVDGWLLLDDPFTSFEQGDFNQVPVIVGANKDEGTLFAAVSTFRPGAVQPPTTLAEYEALLDERYGADAPRVSALYPYSAYANPGAALADIQGDSSYVCPTRRMARAFSRAGVSTFLYTFVHARKFPLLPNLGAFHGAEIGFVFGNPLLGSALEPAEEPLHAAMSGFWTTFAATGDPNGAGRVEWSAYVTPGDPHMVFDLEPSSGSALKTEKCDLWDELP